MTIAAGDTAGTRARAARLRPVVAQHVFRVLLGSVARPGTLATLDVPEHVPPALLPVVALADVEVTLAVLADDAAWAEAVYAVTRARQADLPEADIVLALRPVTADEVASLRRGTDLAPERGARLVTSVRRIDTDDGDVRLRLSGPGVPPGTPRRLGSFGLAADVFDALIAANAEFPAGVDVHLVADDGTLASVPRSTRIEFDDREAD